MKRTLHSMAKTSKRLLVFCLCFVFLLSAFPIGSYLASAEEATEDNTAVVTEAYPEGEEPYLTTVDEDTDSSEAEQTEETPALLGASTEEAAPASIDLEDGTVVDALDASTVSVRVIAVELSSTVQITPGLISANQADAATTIQSQLGNASYMRAVVVYADGTEDEIARVGDYNGATYYALNEFDDTGVKLQDNERIVLVYADVFDVTYNVLPDSRAGTATMPSSIERGETLTIQLSPAQDYDAYTVTYTVGGTTYQAAIADNTVQIDTTNLTDDIYVLVTFQAVTSYTISPASSMWTSTSSSADWEDNGHGGMAANRFGIASEISAQVDANRLWALRGISTDVYTDTARFPNIYTATAYEIYSKTIWGTVKSDNSATSGEYAMAEYYYRDATATRASAYPYNWQMCNVSATPGSDAQFLLYSQDYKNGGTTWVLTALTINGEVIEVPGLTVGDSAETTMKDGTKVTVEYVLKDEGLYWHDDDVKYGDGAVKSWEKYRSFYLVTVENVHTDMDVEWYFQDSDSQKIIVVDRTGIAKTAASEEYMYLQASLIEGTTKTAGTHYYYTITDHNEDDDDDAENVFKAYNTSDSNNQLILYSTKPGYNPYTISALVSYDGSEYTDNFRYTTTTGTAEEVIYSAGGRFNTRFRHWGRSSTLKYTQDNVYTFSYTGSQSSETGSTNPSIFTYISIGSWGGQTRQLVLTSLEEDSTYNSYKWYGIAMNTASGVATQKLKLSATPYQYHVEYDLNGGTLTNTSDLTDNFTVNEEGTSIVDSTIKTVESSERYFTLPIGTPLKDGYIFQGWQLLQKKEITVTGYIADDGRYYTAVYDNSNGGYTKTYYANQADFYANVVIGEASSYEQQGWETYDISLPTVLEYVAEDGEEADDEIIQDDSITYTLTFVQPINTLYAENDRFNLTDDVLDYAFGDVKTDEDMSFTFRAKYASISEADNTEVNYTVYVQVPGGTEGTAANPVTVVNGKTYQVVYDNTEVQAVGDTVVLNQYKPAGADYYYYNTSISKIATTTVKLNEDGSLPGENRLYVYYDYQSANLDLTNHIRGDYANLTAKSKIQITLTATSDNPIQIPAAGTTQTYGGVTFTSDGSKMTGVAEVGNDATITLVDLPYGWNYAVESQEEGYTVTYGANQSGTLNTNMATEVTHTLENPPETGISNGANIDLGTLLLGALGLAVVGYIGYAYFKKGKEDDAQI